MNIANMRKERESFEFLKPMSCKKTFSKSSWFSSHPEDAAARIKRVKGYWREI